MEIQTRRQILTLCAPGSTEDILVRLVKFIGGHPDTYLVDRLEQPSSQRLTTATVGPLRSLTVNAAGQPGYRYPGGRWSSDYRAMHEQVWLCNPKPSGLELGRLHVKFGVMSTVDTLIRSNNPPQQPQEPANVAIHG
jgi:hypothetical protein